MITEQQAIEIAEKHHGPEFKLFSITSGLPENLTVYGTQKWGSDNSWVVVCRAQPLDFQGLRSSRMIHISMADGRILYDGSANDEG